MNDLCITCEGITIGSLRVPAFQLRRREMLCLHMPCTSDSKQTQLLVQALTGQQHAPGLVLRCLVAPAFAASVRAGLVGLLSRPRAVNWLRRAARVSDMVARQAVEHLGIKSHWRLAELSWTERTILGLAAAWLSGAGAVLFITVGLDPLGRQAVYRTVAGRLEQCAAIHLSFGYWTQGRLERDCFPGARCLELTSSAPSAVPLASS